MTFLVNLRIFYYLWYSIVYGFKLYIHRYEECDTGSGENCLLFVMDENLTTGEISAHARENSEKKGKSTTEEIAEGALCWLRKQPIPGRK